MNQKYYDVPEKKYRPDVRWWLAEGLHTDKTLRNEMQMLDDMGMGAIEFLAMNDPGADSKVYGWGSEEWVHDSHVLIEEAAKRQMGFSMTSGTNWSNANLINITPDDKAAAKELSFVEENLKAGETRTGELPRCKIVTENVNVQDLIAVVAAKVVGEKDGKPILDKDTIVLTDQVENDCLTWTAPADGDYKLLTFRIHGTGQTASPSCAISYTINYIDRAGTDALIDYWNKTVLTEDLRKNIAACGRGMMYMDSLELSTFGNGGQFWGYDFNDTFKKNRGYDLVPYLPFIVKKGGSMPLLHDYYYLLEDEAFAEKLHNDLYQTMTDCYMENTMRPLYEWLHSVGMQLRAEISYGLPFEISQPGKYVDGVETESLEFASQVDFFRGLSGAAHIYDRVFSSETGAVVSNYMLPLDFYNQIVFAQFAAGVTRTVFHGYSSICGSEESTYWPGHEGMWPIFAERFGERQPAYRHYPEWTAMIARFQKLLRAGKPRMDLGMLRLDYNFNNLLFGMAASREESVYANEMMRADEANYWRNMDLQHAGYTWDYFAPQILEEDFTCVKDGLLYPDGPGYQALIVYQEVMPLRAAKKLLELAKAGLKIVFVNGVTEEIRPMTTVTYGKAASKTPFVMESDEELAQVIAQIKTLPNVRETDDQSEVKKLLQGLGVEPRAAFAEDNKNILTCMRETEQGINLYVYNMLYAETEPFTVTVKVAGGGKPYIVDCWTGEIKESSGVLCDGATAVTLTLKPGEATMLVLDRNAAPEILPDCRCNVNEIILPKWNLVVEDWTEGEKRTITEDRGVGHISTEVYYETKKTLLDAGEVDTIPWKDIPAVGPEVSGVGFYTTQVEMPADWSAGCGAELEIGSTNGCTAAVYVNGRKAPAYNINKRTVQIGALLKPGCNEIMVEVSSTLNNRLLATGYYDKMLARTMIVMSMAGNHTAGDKDGEADSAMANMMQVHPKVRDYGMTGKVCLRIYKQ